MSALDFQTKKKYLKKVKYLDDGINAKLEQLQDLKQLITAVNGISYNEKVQTSKQGDAAFKVVDKIIDLENEINNDIDELVNLKTDITHCIDCIDEPEYRLVLTLRYINLHQWDYIADYMHYSLNHIYRLHRQALSKLVVRCY